jgi:WD40 repeat protein
MTTKVWESQTGQELLTLKGHTGWIMSAVFSPDGRKIATGSTDGTAKVWDAAPYRGTVSVRAETLDSRHCEGTE